jgi:predicted nucleotidyltransferase
MKTLEQIETISDQGRQLLHEVKQRVRKFLPAAEVLLYGSVARGTQDAESDYDILVLTSEPLSKEEETSVDDSVFELELATGFVVSTIFCSKEQWDTPLYRAMPFHWEIDRDAVVL